MVERGPVVRTERECPDPKCLAAHHRASRIPSGAIMNRHQPSLAAVTLLLCATRIAVAQTALPHVASVTPAGGQRGTTVEVTLTGSNLDAGTGLLFEGAGLWVESLAPEKPAPGAKPAPAPKKGGSKLVARVRIAPDAEPGV